MHPILLQFGPFVIYSYGAMIALGFSVAIIFIHRQAPKFGMDSDKAVDLTVLMLIFGILGARILYVLLNLSHYTANPLEIFMLSKGGLVWYGGFVLGLTAATVYIRMKGLKFSSFADLIVPYVALAQALGRIGCLLNGCCYGIAVTEDFPFAVILPQDNVTRFPSQLLSALFLFLIFIILKVWQKRRRFGGEIVLAYCMLYSLKRFGMEFLRGDNPRILFNLTMSQMISAVIFFTAVILFTAMVKRCKKGPSILK